MLGRSKDSLARDSVHVDADARLQVVEMNETVLGDEVDDAVLLRDLHRDREIVGSLRREENVDGLLRERRVWQGMIDLDDMELCDVRSITLRLKGTKRRRRSKTVGRDLVFSLNLKLVHHEIEDKNDEEN